MRRVGYARGEDLTQQLAILAAAGCAEVVSEHAGPSEARVELNRLVASLGRSDTLVVVRMSAIAVNVRHLLSVARTLSERGISLVVTGADADRLATAANQERDVLVEVEECVRELIAERTRWGLTAARARGRRGGRRRKLDPNQIAEAQGLYDARELTGEEIAARFGITRGTLYRYIVTRNGKAQEETGATT